MSYTYYLIAGGIVLLGAFICFSLIFYGKRKRAKAIEHYEKIRDQLTVREQKEKEEEFANNENLGLPFSISNLIGGFVALLVGVSLVPTIAEQVNLAASNPTNNLPAATVQVLQVVPVFFALAILIIGIATVWGGLRSTGLV